MHSKTTIVPPLLGGGGGRQGFFVRGSVSIAFHVATM
jgi:hypothetical protein